MNNGPERKHFPAFTPTLDAGFDDYLMKPVDMEKLTALLNELIEVLAGREVVFLAAAITTRSLQNSGWDAILTCSIDDELVILLNPAVDRSFVIQAPYNRK